MRRFIAPTQPPPSPVRPLLSTAMATLNPLPSSPRTQSAGTLTLSKRTVVVHDARMPILSSLGPELTPCQSRSTMKAVILPPSLSVLANTVKNPAVPPFVIQIFSPVRLQLPSAFFVAYVLTEAASDPEPLSVRQNAAMSSPEARRGRYRAFCPSVPKRSSAFMPIELCAPIVSDVDPS